MLKLLLLYTLFCWKCKRILESVWGVIIEEKMVVMKENLTNLEEIYG